LGSWEKTKTVLGKIRQAEGKREQEEDEADTGRKRSTKQTGGQSERANPSGRKIDIDILKRVPVFTGGMDDVVRTM
jgi:hypothetical protein